MRRLLAARAKDLHEGELERVTARARILLSSNYMIPRALRSVLPTRRASLLAIALVVAAASLSGPIRSAQAYALNGKSWASGTVTMQLGLGNANPALTDGNSSYNTAVAPALDAWNQVMGRVQFGSVMNSSAPASSGDRVNCVVWSSTVFGQSFGNGTLAVTYYITQGSNMVEADILFNNAQNFDSYRGPLKFQSSGFALADIRRVFLHELGHALGMNHSQGDVVMNAITSDREVLAADDIAGAQAMYGVGLPVPTPTPILGARLANISTRMKVGVGAEVLIGGFIIKGSQPKQLLLRATGPSLAAGGVSGALADPALELYNSSGAIIAQNDNWQAGGQAAAISATGVAPSNPAEAALIATLAPGSYTAMVRGVGGTQGVALVEGYELDTPSTRMVNLSTRGRIGVGDQVLIGGLIVSGNGGKRVLIRAVGPSLAAAIDGALADPTLELYNSAGALVSSNDNWQTSPQAAEIIASTVAPSNAAESAVVATLAPGNYTAIVRGVNGGVGIGLIEVYDLEP